MEIVILVIIEQLHRLVFSKYYQQNYNIKCWDRLVLKIYKYIFRKHINWRHDLINYSKTLVRYNPINLKQNETTN